MQLDVFTLLPHAFAWLTEQRPVAAVLGDELDLRLLNYRDYTPLTGGQVDDEPYGGGAGMVLRVDVVAAALDAVYGGTPDHRVIALTPQGRQLTQAVVEELAAEERLTLLSARFEGFDERALDPPRLRRDLDRAVRPLGRRAAGDGAGRRDRPSAARRARARIRARSRASRPSSRAASSTLSTRVRRSSEAGGCRTSCCRAITGESTSGGRNKAD